MSVLMPHSFVVPWFRKPWANPSPGVETDFLLPGVGMGMSSLSLEWEQDLCSLEWERDLCSLE